MKITNEEIAKLNPCQDRHENYLKFYKDKAHFLAEFIELENITYSDKVWVVTRLFTKSQNVQWSILCAESVLHLFEEKYPDDKRPRNAIEAAKNVNAAAAYADARAAADAAYADARAAADAAYAADARAAADAAAYAADARAAAADAAYAADARAAAYAAARAAAYAAAAARAAADAEKEQETKNLSFMLMCDDL